MDTIRFEAETELLAGAVIVRLPAAASAQLPSRGQVAVDAAVNGDPRPLVVEPDGRRGHWLKLSPDDAADGPVTVELAPSGTWPEPELPDDLRAALVQASDLADTWTDITPMARWEWVRWVNATRNPDTRRRRVEGEHRQAALGQASSVLLPPLLVHRRRALPQQQARRTNRQRSLTAGLVCSCCQRGALGAISVGQRQCRAGSDSRRRRHRHTSRAPTGSTAQNRGRRGPTAGPVRRATP